MYVQMRDPFTFYLSGYALIRVSMETEAGAG